MMQTPLEGLSEPILKKVNEVAKILNDVDSEEERFCYDEIIDVTVINPNAFFLTFAYEFGDLYPEFYETKLFVSNDKFMTKTKDLVNEDNFLPNLVGQVFFTVNRNTTSVNLDNIEVGEIVRHMGYGKSLMKYFINLINNNEKVSYDTKFTKITGVFYPSEDISRDAVKNFYESFGANPEKLDNGLIQINLEDESENC